MIKGEQERKPSSETLCTLLLMKSFHVMIPVETHTSCKSIKEEISSSSTFSIPLYQPRPSFLHINSNFHLLSNSHCLLTKTGTQSNQLLYNVVKVWQMVIIPCKNENLIIHSPKKQSCSVVTGREAYLSGHSWSSEVHL